MKNQVNNIMEVSKEVREMISDELLKKIIDRVNSYGIVGPTVNEYLNGIEAEFNFQRSRIDEAAVVVSDCDDFNLFSQVPINWDELLPTEILFGTWSLTEFGFAPSCYRIDNSAVNSYWLYEFAQRSDVTIGGPKIVSTNPPDPVNNYKSHNEKASESSGAFSFYLILPYVTSATCTFFPVHKLQGS
ncbi:MAG: hypothetical protein K9J17_15450 [Flavobacteriales bacterium]|nr:hypothetical protein [Flavobacteriales bacterium]